MQTVKNKPFFATNQTSLKVKQPAKEQESTSLFEPSQSALFSPPAQSYSSTIPSATSLKQITHMLANAGIKIHKAWLPILASFLATLPTAAAKELEKAPRYLSFSNGEKSKYILDVGSWVAKGVAKALQNGACGVSNVAFQENKAEEYV